MVGADNPTALSERQVICFPIWSFKLAPVARLVALYPGQDVLPGEGLKRVRCAYDAAEPEYGDRNRSCGHNPKSSKAAGMASSSSRRISTIFASAAALSGSDSVLSAQHVH